MSVTEKKIIEAIAALRDELEQLDVGNEAARARLEALVAELERKLELAEHQSMVDDMKDAIATFEVKHPRITGILNDLMVTLGNLGI